MKKYFSKETLAALFIIFLFIIPIATPLLHKGYFLSDDGEWMVIRLTAFFEALRHGQIPARFLIRLSNEYGYPLSNFAYPGFLYLGSLIHLFKFGYIETIKIIFFLTFLFSGVFTYLFLRRKFDWLSSISGSFIYIYTPYHLFDLYRRGSIGELLAISIIPFLFWQIERGNKYLISVGVFLLILAHNSIALISLPFIFIYSILSDRQDIRRKFPFVVWPYILGLLLSSFFSIPSAYDLRYIIFQGLKIADWHLFFGNLMVLGISTVIILVLSVYFWIKNRKDLTLSFFIILSLFSAFMGTAISTIIWNFFPSSFIIFPFRFLSILPMGLSYLSAFILMYLNKNLKYFALTILVILAIYSSSFFLSPTKYLDTDDNYYLNNFASTTANNEYTPKWVLERPDSVPSERVEVSGSTKILSQSFDSKKILISENSDKDSKLKINIVYFPGWEAYVDGKTTAIDYHNKNGVMIITVPKGLHNVSLKYNETGIHLLSDLISILAFIALILIFVKEKRYVFKNN